MRTSRSSIRSQPKWLSVCGSGARALHPTRTASPVDHNFDSRDKNRVPQLRDGLIVAKVGHFRGSEIHPSTLKECPTPPPPPPISGSPPLRSACTLIVP